MKMKLSFGDKVRVLREEQNLSQTELGKALNMTQRKVSYIECGKYEPSIEDIVAIAVFFDVSADYLLGISKGKPYPER
ncbi:MAG: helix-turn-helix transcriptional regulator [Ruminococcaceae bacterium]|nr:helix-turn-helix transcriptional regulator [Oscillospiraceae bacterium]